MNKMSFFCNDKRLCKTCNMPLSKYNKTEVCFCHKEHPDEDHITYHGCAGHATPELNLTIFNEYGLYGFNH